MIIDRLEEKGPATPKQLRDELGVHKNTVNRNLRKILFKKLGIVERLENDRYGLRWHLPEEDRVKLHYSRTKRKLRRNPTPEEMAGLIKEAPEEARRLLFKYIPFYREPDQNEISLAASEVWKMIVWGGLSGQPKIKKEQRLKTKKELFDMGVSKAAIDGIAIETFDMIMNKDPSIPLEEARRYIEEFPEMKPRITETRDGGRLSSKIEWPEDVKKILHSSYQWRGRSEVQVPRRLDEKLYRRYREFIDKNADYALGRIGEMARDSAPTQETIDDLLRWIAAPETRSRALDALSSFCKNGLEVGQLDEDARIKIAHSLLETFFGDTSDDTMYEDALKIIEMVDVRDEETVAKCKRFIGSSLRKGGHDLKIMKLGGWLAKDPMLREGLIKISEDIMAGAEDDRVSELCKRFIRSI
jgi:DNA-binding MarR family transcriptional regulator